VLAQGLGTRASLGYPGDKYEMGLEAIERIEIIAAELAAEVFGARFVEIRVPSGRLPICMCSWRRPSRGTRLLLRRRRSAGM
jgi:glycine/serine hydroxymethyltransferase